MEPESCPIVSAIRRAADTQGLRPWTLAKAGSLTVAQWQTLLDRDDLGRLSHANVMAAAAQLGLRVAVAKQPA